MNRKTFKKLLVDIQNLMEKKEEALENANERNEDDRVEKLDREIILLDEMCGLLEEYIDL